MKKANPRTPRRSSPGSIRRIPESLIETKRDSNSRKYNIGALATPLRKTSEQLSSLLERSDTVTSLDIPSFCTPTRKTNLPESQAMSRACKAGSKLPLVMPGNLDDSEQSNLKSPSRCAHSGERRRSCSLRNSLRSRRQKALVSRANNIKQSPRRESIARNSPVSKMKNETSVASQLESYRWENISIDDGTVDAQASHNDSKLANRRKKGKNHKECGRLTPPTMSPKRPSATSSRMTANRKFRSPKKDNNNFEKSPSGRIKPRKEDPRTTKPMISTISVRLTDTDLSSVSMSLDDTSIAYSTMSETSKKAPDETRTDSRSRSHSPHKSPTPTSLVPVSPTEVVAVPVAEHRREASSTWVCVCGNSSKKTKHYCGMCGTAKNWVCQSCGEMGNLCLYSFCAMCGVPKKNASCSVGPGSSIKSGTEAHQGSPASVVE